MHLPGHEDHCSIELVVRLSDGRSQHGQFEPECLVVEHTTTGAKILKEIIGG